MTYSGNVLIIGSGTASASDIDRWFTARGPGYAAYAPDGRYKAAPAIGDSIVGYARLWGVNSDLVSGQIMHESAGWQSKYSRLRNNPSGLGAINSAPDEALSFDTPDMGIRATVAHLCDYAIGKGDWTQYDPRYAAMVEQGDCVGRAPTLNGLDQRWAFTPTATYNATPANQRYGAGIAVLANDLVAFVKQTGGAVVDISGFVPPRVVQQWFPVNGVSYLGEPMQMHGVAIHETGNTGAGAEAQANVNYMNTQECIQREASWHATVGLEEVIETIRDTFQAFHASDSDGPGNTHYFAIEGVMCYPVGTPEFKRVMMNHAWYAAKKLRDKGLPITFNPQNTAYNGSSVCQHNTFARDHKDCPQFYRDAGLWGQFCDYAQAFYDRNEWGAPAPPADVLTIPNNPHGDIAVVRGFKSFVETLAAARFPQDKTAAILSIFGFPEAPEYLAKDGNVYQLWERQLLQFNPKNAVPFDIVAMRREDEPPEAA